FAVLPVSTISFAGAKYLVDNHIPTFGWNIQAEWSQGPNLFGEKGSNLCFDCPTAWLPYVMKQIGATNIGVVTYTQPQSQERGKPANENSLSGWINGMQFVQGLKDAGPDFNRQSLIDAINRETNFTADGIRPNGINWATTGHTGHDPSSCAVILKVQGGVLVP